MTHRTLTLLTALLSGCPTKLNPKYCDATHVCVQGTCDTVRRECVPEYPDMLSPPAIDLAVADDLSELPDLTLPLPDLSRLPDLTELPDLTPFPDLEPPPVYFDPDVQTILNLGGGGGCAKSGCHDAGDGLYLPFLIPNPSTTAAVHANYLSFSAEPSATTLQKLVKNSGTAHGGTMTSIDRKPCTDIAAEPCATLNRWYIAGMPENAP